MRFHIRTTILVVFFSSSVCSFVNAQFDLTGKVYDAQTEELLPFTNVFVAHSTIGTTTDENGMFTLKDVPKGNQELVFSYLGYEPFVKKININKFSTEKEIVIKLQPNSVDLETIEVTTLSEKKRKKYLKKFTKAFLGNTVNADLCTIMNPEVIDFKISANTIEASSNDLIKIENRSTGYLVKFHLEHFEMEGDQIAYGGKPLFEKIDANNEEEEILWKAQRVNTYKGSSRHFYSALVNDNLKKEGFKIYLAEQKSASEFDNIRPIFASSIIKDGPSDNYKYLKLNDFLKIEFTSKGEEDSDRQQATSFTSLGRPSERELIEQSVSDMNTKMKYPTSYLFARKSTLKINTNGQLLNPEWMVTYGHWADEGVADLLPFDFELSEKDKQPVSTQKGFQLSNLLIPVNEIKDGGPPPDGIPSIDRPKFENVIDANFIKEKENVLGVYYNGIAKAYPIKIMDLHEIVNDQFGDQAITVTFCPLCGSGVSFNANIENMNRTFGVSGLLYNSDVLLFDRATNSLWSPIKGQAISGKSSGQVIQFIPTELTTWGDWKTRFPDTKILSPDTGYAFDYSKKAYIDYLASEQLMFPVSKKNKALKNKDKVIGIEVEGQFKAYPFKKLRKVESPIKDKINGKELMIFYDKSSNSAWIEDNNGTILNGMTMFWFAWYAFHSETSVFQ